MWLKLRLFIGILEEDYIYFPKEVKKTISWLVFFRGFTILFGLGFVISMTIIFVLPERIFWSITSLTLFFLSLTSFWFEGMKYRLWNYFQIIVIALGDDEEHPLTIYDVGTVHPDVAKKILRTRLRERALLVKAMEDEKALLDSQKTLEAITLALKVERFLQRRKTQFENLLFASVETGYLEPISYEEFIKEGFVP